MFTTVYYTFAFCKLNTYKTDIVD